MTVIDLFDRGLLIMNTHPEKMDLVIFLMLEREEGRALIVRIIINHLQLSTLWQNHSGVPYMENQL